MKSEWKMSVVVVDGDCRIVENGTETTTVAEDGVVKSRTVKPIPTMRR